jgi:hypothetical protein
MKNIITKAGEWFQTSLPKEKNEKKAKSMTSKQVEQVIDKAISDNILTEDELDSLLAIADEQNINRAEFQILLYKKCVEKLRCKIEDMLCDGIIDEDERKELSSCALSLQITESDFIRLLNEGKINAYHKRKKMKTLATVGMVVAPILLVVIPQVAAMASGVVTVSNCVKGVNELCKTLVDKNNVEGVNELSNTLDIQTT